MDEKIDYGDIVFQYRVSLLGDPVPVKEREKLLSETHIFQKHCHHTLDIMTSLNGATLSLPVILIVFDEFVSVYKRAFEHGQQQAKITNSSIPNSACLNH